MKKIILYFILSAITMTVTFYSQNTYSLAFSTWEEAREWFKENGVPTTGGTHMEVSICPGQDAPQGDTSSINNTTQKEINSTGNQQQSTHEHTYIETLTKNPTCIENGIKTFTCSCGDKYTESIETVEHTYSKEIVTQKATCTVNGKKLISCTVCNDTYEEDIEPLGHENGEWVLSKVATCTENGEEIVNCKRCGEIIDSRSIEALGHTEGEWITTKKATMFSEGLNELKCTTCGEVLNTEIIPINLNVWYAIIVVIAVAVIVGLLVMKKKR